MCGLFCARARLIIRDFKVMLNAVSFYATQRRGVMTLQILVCFSAVAVKDAFRVWLLLVSTVGALLAQIIGSIYGYLAYREASPSDATLVCRV